MFLVIILQLSFGTTEQQYISSNLLLIMASSSDKARFYLEQSVPELQELRRNKIFTKASYRPPLLYISNLNFVVARSHFNNEKKIGL